MDDFANSQKSGQDLEKATSCKPEEYLLYWTKVSARLVVAEPTNAGLDGLQ